MLTIILNWIYILFTVFCMGFVFFGFVEKVLHYSVKHMDAVLTAGLVIATVYAQTFSLFYRVNAEANAVMLFFCLAACIAMRKRMLEFVRERWGSCSAAGKVLVPVLFLVWCFFTSRGYRVLDMDLYHGQSIRWIEEYGAVKGLGNLHSRFGYNSSFFSVSALYSMRFLLGRSLHTVNGLMAFIMSVGALKLGRCFSRRKMLLSDYARVGLVYYLTIIWDEIIAPSSDYAVMLVIFFIVIKWLELLEDEKDRENAAPYALLCVAAVYALTLKLTAGLILILVLKPAWMLLKGKKWGQIGIYLALGLATAVPWMARTVVITGWLLYPYADLDLFSVDWKMTDESIIRTDSYLIKIWAKGANQLPDTRLTTWFPNWFLNHLTLTERLLILADMAACAAAAVSAGLMAVRKRRQELEKIFVIVTVMCCYLFWQFTAPMMRYGYAYVLLLAALAAGYILERTVLRRIVYVALLLYGTYKLGMGVQYGAGCFRTPCYVWQETYENYEMEAYEIDGVTFYYSPYAGATGYDPFPAAPTPALIRLRGEGLKDGFRLP